MKSLYLGCICFLLVSACKSDSSKNLQTETITSFTAAENIANAHGFEHWETVSKVAFTFKVDRDTIKGKGRSWEWYPKKDSIIMLTDVKTITYKRTFIEEEETVNADRSFINDKFWLLIPFQLVWDSTASISDPKKMESPIHKTQLNMITITYSNQGGYTPGDAYDIYYDDNFIIQEWTFRKGNAKTPTLSTTFENYISCNGIKIAKDHKMIGGNWNLNFTDISITLDN